MNPLNKKTLEPNGVLFIGGPWDGRLEEFGADKPPKNFYTFLQTEEHDVARFMDPSVMDPVATTFKEVVYRRTEFFVSDTDRNRLWAFYISDDLTVEEAFAKLVMCYALRRDSEQFIQSVR